MEKFIFDIDGTLLVKDYRYEEEFFKSILGEEDANKFLGILSSLIAKYEKAFSKYDISIFSNFLSENSGINITDDIVREWLAAGSKCDCLLYPGVFEVLEYLKQKNIKIVALTNWFSDMQIGRLKNKQIFDYFDEIYCGDNSAFKPRVEAYKAACGDTDFSKCVMIGDSLEKDILIPLELGMDVVYFCPRDNIKCDEAKVKVIKKLESIKEMY